MVDHGWLFGVVDYIEYFLFAFISLFVIISPISTVPLFLGITPDNSPQERETMARTACKVAGVALLFFALLGQLLFSVFGITTPAFQTAGGILIFLIALDMVLGKEAAPSAVMSSEDRAVALRMDDVAITPLAIPLVAGPGSISTVILLQSKAEGWLESVILIMALASVIAVTYMVFRFAAYGGKWLNPLLLRVTKRLMGLLLSAVAVQFVFNGLRSAGFLGAAAN